MKLFTLKNRIANLFSGDPEKKFNKEEKLLIKRESLLFQDTEQVEYDEEQTKELRAKTRYKISLLENALKRTQSRADSRDIFNQIIKEGSGVKELRDYERELRRQLSDIRKIIILLKEIVENEFREIEIDIKTPLNILLNFLKLFNQNVNQLRIEKKYISQIKDIIQDIIDNYPKIINDTITLLGNERKVIEGNTNINAYFRNRGRIKQQINGKTQWMLSQLRKLEETFLELESKGLINKEISEQIINLISGFRKQFDDLIVFFEDRIKVSNSIIVEAIQTQKSKVKEMDELKKEAEGFYKQFESLENVKRQKTESDFKKAQIDKRRDEFAIYENEMMSLVKDIDKFVLSVEKEDLNVLDRENKDVARSVNRVKKFSKKTGVLIALTFSTLMTGFASLNAPAESFIGTLKDTTKHTILHTSMTSEIMKMAYQNPQLLQKSIDQIYKKLRSGSSLTPNEVTFIQTLYRLMISGGVVSVIPGSGLGQSKLEAAKLLNYYLSGKGGKIEVDGSIYETSTVVQRSIKEMSQLIEQMVQKKKLGDGRHLFTSRDLLRKQSFGNVNQNGQILNGGILLTEQNNKSLKYMNNRFTLSVIAEVKGDKIDYTWFVNDEYVWSNDYVSEMQLPSGFVLKVPDGLSGALTRYGAKNFNYNSTTWHTSTNLATK